MLHSFIIRIAGLSAVLLLAACAQSPQRVEIAPSFSAPTAVIGRGQPVHVRVSDERKDTVLGSRGGSYRETAVITIGNDFSRAVQEALAAQLKALGYDTDSLSAETVDLHVVFEQLVYNHPETAGLGHDMDMLAVVRSEASRDGERYQGSYRIKRTQKFFNAPSDTHNSQLINELVVEVLNNMLADPKLLAFLDGK